MSEAGAPQLERQRAEGPGVAEDAWGAGTRSRRSKKGIQAPALDKGHPFLERRWVPPVPPACKGLRASNYDYLGSVQ